VKFSRYRGYPYPSNGREGGRGGSHSEALARAVARDLDGLDAAWPLLQAPASIVLRMSASSDNRAASLENPVSMDIVDKITGTGLANDASGVRVVAGGEGWYHVVATCRSNAMGAITAGAQHRLQLQEQTTNSAGILVQRLMRYTETFQQGSTDNYNQLEAMIYLGVGDKVRMWFFHTNTGSLGRVVNTGTRLMATKILGG
jgi:hypothetical protein